MNKVLLVVCVAAIVAIGSAEHWAVLVAGSDGFWNYRHQADICHAYQILVKNGFKPENIITFAKDDVPNDPSNPYKGTLFNKPDPKGKGWNVNDGCNKDYTGKNVKPSYFLNVLKGDEKAMKNIGTGKVLKSGPEDQVFIYFSDHGAPGLIAFPDEYLYANQLLPVLNYMNQNNMYKKLVFYLEACESGSMFVQLPTNINIYAVSAANPTESSWAFYCDDDIINGKTIGSCLGDEFSIQWLEDSDNQDIFKETLDTQFQHVRNWTLQSHVMQWGDTTWTNEVVGNYQGNSDINMTRSLRTSYPKRERPQGKAVDSRDVKLHYLMKRHMRLNTLETEVELRDELKERQYFTNLFNSIKSQFSLSQEEVDALEEVVNYACYERAINSINRNCRKISDYGLKYLRIVAAACNKYDTEDHVENYIVNQFCPVPELSLIHI
eukprot:TRINITY_DN367_c0_g1_i2.p1 TRINITY_DN367_c0_g1~~TRINITY_DN367_c0_g1_i2.p1  ORF type:complete len:436 (-),score=137.44 TRINITY_DN367_c0_g1_i2:70-1377(-)